MTLRSFLLLALSLQMTQGAGITAQTLDQAERELQAAKEQQARQAAAERAARERQQAEAAAAAKALREQEAADAAAAEAIRREEAARGKLIVRADADCTLRINTLDKGRLTANQSQIVPVDPGEQLIECDAGDGRLVEAVESVPRGEQKVVRLTVPPPAPPARFVPVADGVQDNEQGIVWAASDNGSDIDWNSATSFCASRGGGWSLPTVAQAQSLYDAAGTFARPQYEDVVNLTIKPATDLIRFSQGAAWLWTFERENSGSAFSVWLSNGHKMGFPVSDPLFLRALCVRRRS